MSELNLVKFRKLALSFFLCFPNVRKISFTKSYNRCYMDLWKNVNIENRGGEWVNSNMSYFSASLCFPRCAGLFGRIPIDFLGFDSIDDFLRCRDSVVVDRKSLRLNDIQINTNDSRTLNKMVDRICKFSNLKSITFCGFGKVNLKNINDQMFEIPMRGSGIRTSIRNEITKSC